jgi:SSS family solute:Na+ symporter
MPSLGSHAADFLVIAVYLAATLVIGLWAHRLWRSGPEDEESYYLAGRRVPALMNGVSYAATAINADVAPLYCGMAAVIGLPVAWFYLSRFGLAWMIVAMLFAARWRQLNIRTGPEFYALRFGGRGARFVRIYTALFAVAVSMVPWIGAGLLGTHKIMQPVLGVESKWATLACVVPLVAGYVWVSGFAGVLITDVFQSAVIVVASAALLIAVLVNVSGPTELAEAIKTAHPAEHGEILSTLPVPGHEILGPMLVLAWLIVPTIGRGGSVDLDGQRIFSCRTAREAAKVTIWGQLAMFVMLLLITLPVLGMLAKHPDLYHATRGNREQVYGLMLVEYLPPGVLGLVVAGALASVMSTISGYLNYGSQTVVNDVLRQIFPNAAILDPRHPRVLWVGRVITLVILLAGVWVMYASDSLFRIAMVISGMFAASAAYYWAQWWWWRANLASWVAAMVGGPAIYFLLDRLLPQLAWWNAQLAAGEAAIDAMAMLHAMIAIVLTTMLWVVVALVTKPESQDTLTSFYRRARPLGWWEPVRRMIAAEALDQSSASATPPLLVEPRFLLLGGLGVAVVGAAWIAAGVLGVSQLTVGNWTVAAGLLIAAAAGGLAFRYLFDWHMNRLEAD